MKLTPPVSDEQISGLCAEAVGLLVDGQYEALAAKFGYVLAYGREPASAIEADLKVGLSNVGAARLTGPASLSSTAVVHLQKNDTGLRSAVDFEVPADNGATILVSLVVTGQGDERYLSLEDVCGVA
ncbi:MAG: hypothetical protein U1F08_13475 [Steroidobacteraceae bacterium]